MSLIPPDISVYYSKLDKSVLYQGDIIKPDEIGIEVSDNTPDYWLIITKSCDLVVRDGQKKTKSDIYSLLGIYSIKKHFNIIKSKYFLNPKNDFLGRIVMAAVFKFSESTKSISKNDHLNNLIDDKISKLMFLPPDGQILKEPMIVDFDFIHPLQGEKMELVLAAKKLQLSSPFRERLSQRFAIHYSSIGIDDNQIKSSSYRDGLKKYFESIKK